MSRPNPNLIVGIIVAFAIVSIIAYLGINWTSTIDAPTDTTSAEYQQYENLTDTVDIAHTGQEGTILLLIVAMIFAVIVLLIAYAKKAI